MKLKLKPCGTLHTMKILVDNGIVSSSSILVAYSQEQELPWGKTIVHSSIAGFKRAELDRDPDQQRDKDALFTIGRLARAGRITLHTYSELLVENWRGGRGRDPFVNALVECRFQHCPAAIERSRFRTDIDLKKWFAKGGNRDREKGLSSSDSNQIPYFEWLSLLSPQEVALLMSHARILRLDDFEIASLHDLPWFQNLARTLGSRENLPDCFHLWTARRNRLDVFLTLEKKLPRSIEQLKSRRKSPIDIRLDVLRPTELLRLLGIAEMDAVPVEPGRFYTFTEILAINGQLLQS
jgi:hypothetical protein